MKKYALTYKPFGPAAILIEWPAKIDEDIIRNIGAFEKSIDKSKTIADTFIAYNSLLIRYGTEVNFESEVERLKRNYETVQSSEWQESKCWQVPVCYDAEFGLDSEEITEAKKISVEELIHLHCEPEYLVCFIGFQPGFLYLGGLDERIHMPRKANPRKRIPKGSVGIGGEQTGVYPNDSAGGWNIIGRSPIDFFDIEKSNPSFAKAGDRIKFVSVDRDVYEEIAERKRQGKYELQFETL